MQNTMHTYIVAISPVAIVRPQKPPAARPKFQPKYSPEITTPTPSAHNDSQLAFFWSLRLSRYSAPTFSYRMKPELGAFDTRTDSSRVLVELIVFSRC